MSSIGGGDDIKLEIERRKEEIRRKKEALEAYKNKKSASGQKVSFIEGLVPPRSAQPQQTPTELEDKQEKISTAVDDSKISKQSVVPLVDTKKAAAIQRGELFDITNNGTIISEVGGEVKRVRELKLISRVNVIDLPPIVSCRL